MALDQLEHYHNIAEAHRESAQLMAYFAAIAKNGGDAAAVKQIGHYEDVLTSVADLYDGLATGDDEG